MPATYTPSLRLTKPSDGDINWGQTVNTGLTELVDSSVAGTTTITMTAADYTLTNTNGTTDEARRMFIVATGSPGAPRNVICPAVSKLYFFRNDTAFTLTLKTPSGSGVAVPAGQYQILYCNGTNVVEAANAFGSLTTGTLTAASLSLTTALAATSGGTGQNSYAVGDLLYASSTTALSKLADVATGNALISGGVGVAPLYGKIGLTTHVSGTLPLANGGTGLTTIPALSIFVANTLNTLISLTATAGQSIRINAGGTAWEAYTSATGDAVLANSNIFTGANTFYNNTGQTFGTATATQDGIIIAGRAGGTSTYRVTLSPGTLTASRAVTLPDAAGNVVIDTATQTLTNKTLTSPTLTTPALGTPTSGVLTNCTGTAVDLTAGNVTQTTIGTAVNVTTASTSGSSTTTGAILITTGDGLATGNSGNITVKSGNIDQAGGPQTAGTIAITGGGVQAAGQGFGGSISITAGLGRGASGGGGNVSITAGNVVAAGATGSGGKVTLTAGNSDSTAILPGAVEITAGNSTGGLVGADIKLTTGTGSSNGKINFVNCDVANGSVATTITSLGPTGSNTTIQGWLAVKINGTARYIPFW